MLTLQLIKFVLNSPDLIPLSFTLCVAVFLSIILAASWCCVSMSGTEGRSLDIVSDPELEVEGSKREIGFDIAYFENILL